MPPHHFSQRDSQRDSTAESGAKLVDLQISHFPLLAEKWVTGWRDTCNSGTIASALLAAIAGAIFIHIEEKLKPSGVDPALNPESAKAIALLVVAYLAVLCNCTAAVVSFFISDKLIASPLDAELKPGVTHAHQKDLFVALRQYYMWSYWTLSKYYWLLNLSAGFFCLFAEFVLYAWVFESNLAVKITVAIFSFFGVIPLIVFWFEILRTVVKGLARRN
ncbi:hypothetical protein FRC14_007990 [Serendipita sp. 396]|nr:hypothetical protein FRC14_007990 [Serendipita sp. 396]KAG8793588.1 hypothetical protein FRC16_010903 [Serendipita sp. 398]